MLVAVRAVVVARGVVTSWQDDEATRPAGERGGPPLPAKKDGQGRMESYGIQFYEQEA